MLTVVMLNWRRPDNVRRFAGFYATHDSVSQVLIGDCNAHGGNAESGRLCVFSGAPRETTDKIVVLGMTGDLGLPSRFALGGLARTDDVLIVDDDIELPDHTIRVLYREYQRNNAGAVGLFGRHTDENGNYNIRTHHGAVEILLTRAVITSRAVCCEALYQSVRMAEALGGEPYGNGEDIVMSHVAMKISGVPNLAFNLPYKNHGYDDAHAISVRYPGHEAHRTRVVRWCREFVPCGPRLAQIAGRC